MASAYPNTKQKHPGEYVENVHPCNRGAQPGYVISAEYDVDGGTLLVRVGTGSTVYGPAENWRHLDRRPNWMTDEQAAEIERQRDELAARRAA